MLIQPWEIHENQKESERNMQSDLAVIEPTRKQPINPGATVDAI